MSPCYWVQLVTNVRDHQLDPVLVSVKTLHLFTLLIRFEVQVSSRPRRTLFSSRSCLRMNWRWSTWSAPSWWLFANCSSCSLSAQTTCCVSNWWCSWGPSGQTMRWEKRARSHNKVEWKSRRCLSVGVRLPSSVRWLQRKVCQRWACLSSRRRVVVGGWGHWVSRLTNYVNRCSRWEIEQVLLSSIYRLCNCVHWVKIKEFSKIETTLLSLYNRWWQLYYQFVINAVLHIVAWPASERKRSSIAAAALQSHVPDWPQTQAPGHPACPQTWGLAFLVFLCTLCYV